MQSIKIEHYTIGREQQPLIIAEMSGNHNQSLDRALAIVDAAADCGVQALKLQTYTADTMTIDSDEGEFFIDDPNSLWKGNSLYKLYQQAYTPWEWHKPIFDRCQEHGILGFSTPFDESAVDFLESLDVPCYKIASFEMTDLPLIRKVAATGKPMIISTGMATVAEIDETVRVARQSGCQKLILLKCTSTYPAAPTNTNLMTIPHMGKLFDCQVGLSDHTMGIGASIASVALGATIIEKHFTLSRSDGGVDSAFSLEPPEMKAMVTECKRAFQALGQITYGPMKEEELSLHHRRSLYVVEDIRKGEFFTKKNVRAIRPGLGLPTKYLDIVIGRKAQQNVSRGTPVSWDFL
ncbi:pseudaminic acid synthase [Pelosinus propionicus]|uniref:N-acetylneuraminate synthase n=1 Tax=Pelosinus propionicus DSM 13327 TaxID=1123291 RepID=A0A1I4HUP9_9FIRM|nr:pseudaminic acid synthase [Pelosinus propionicus]SFL45503.1 N-acetylneuraminate synthase [Pelosinus propionicus DSM 13327]